MLETKKVFQIISVLLHPIFIPCIIAGLFLFGVNEAPWLDAKARWSLFSLISTITTLMPISCLLIMQRFGVVKSPQMHQREERAFALSIMIISLAILCYLLIVKINVSTALSISFCSVTITLIIANIANFVDKISLHSIGLSGLIGILFYFIREAEAEPNIVLFDAFGISIILLGVVMTARLYLQAHTFYQIIIGALLGVFSGFGGAIISAYYLQHHTLI
ncbi:hypothetical protein [Flammeovirga sp. OC4]|uniref:hypothetical protein n=1 Tax=Flammeovirga sp. OC4 TaxID=1382345 RepID=UPI0005C4F434|nr:hypothetical protein [Flammeovirga sp. OC4]